MSDKDGSTTNGADGELKLTAQESKLFTHIVKQLPKTIDIDWDQVAAEVGFKNGEVAKTRCRQIRTKLGIYGTSGAGAPVKSGPSQPKNPNRVIKPGKQIKPKKSKHVSNVVDGGVKDEEMAYAAQDGEF